MIRSIKENRTAIFSFLIIVFLALCQPADTIEYKKGSEWTEDTAPALTDQVLGIKAPSGTPLSRKVSYQSIYDLFKTSYFGTLTDGRFCTYDATGTEIDCNSTNIPTASALASNPGDCSPSQFANTIAASGNLGCAALVDADIPNDITITLAATATAFATNPSDCDANQFANTIAASGNLGCAALADADIPDTITVDGDYISNDTIDDDSIDFADVTCADITTTDCGATTTGNLQTGRAGADGLFTIYSEQGATDYYAQFVPHAAMTQNTAYTLPANDGDANQLLSTDGSGALSWVAPTAGDNITEGNTSVTVTDAGSGDVTVSVDGVSNLVLTGLVASLANTYNVRTASTTTAHEFSIQLYDVDGTAWVDALNFANGDVPTITSGAITIDLTDSTVNLPAVSAATIADGGTLTFDEAAANPNDADVQFTAADGVLTIASVNGANNESLTFDFDATENSVAIGTGSGVTGISLGSINLASTGIISSAVGIFVTTDGTESPSASQMYGTMFIADHDTATSDTDYTLPGAAVGMNACFYDNGGGAGGIIIDAAAEDEILLDGGGVGAADAIDSPGVAGDGANGDFICLVAIDATNWITLGRSGTWVDGGAD